MTTAVILGSSPADTIILPSQIGTPAILSGPENSIFVGGNQGPQGKAAKSGFGFFLPGYLKTPSQMLMRYESVGVTYIDPALARASVDIDKVAQATTIIGVLVDSVQVGTITFAAGQTHAAISLSITQLNDGQVMTLIGPATIDPLLSDITIVFITN